MRSRGVWDSTPPPEPLTQLDLRVRYINSESVKKKGSWKEKQKTTKARQKVSKKGSGRVNPSAPWAWTRLSWASKCVLAVACRHAVPHILCTPCVTWRLRLLLRLRVCAGRALPPPAPPPALNANARTRTRTSKCVLAVACRHAVPHILCTPCVAWRRGGGRGRGASASVPPVPPRLRLPLTSSATGKQDKEEGGSSAGSRPPPYAPGRVEAAQILKESVSYACTARSDDLLTFENVR